MVRVAGVTDEAPTRRMSVARGVLLGAPHGIAPDLLAAARTAAVYAVKDAPRVIPSVPSFSLTEAFCDLAWDDEGWVATVTVVGYARTSLDTTALAGVGAAILSLWDAAKGLDPGLSESMRATELRVVQNVTG